MKKFGSVISQGLLSACLVGCITFSTAALANAQDPDQITAADMKGVTLQFTTINRMATGQNGTQQATLPGISGIDSVPNFSGAYSTPGFDPKGNPNSNWLFNTLGNAPSQGGTTMVNAPIVPVSLDFRNADGSERFVRVVNGRAITCGVPIEPGCHRLFFDANTAGSGGTTFLQRILDSPVFSNANYTSSSTPTQFADAVARAEYQGAPDDWHTLLVPSVKATRTMVINQDPTCGIGAGKGGHCSYLYALNPDGRCCFFVLIDVNVFVNELFLTNFSPPATTVVGAAEAAGDVTTKDVATFFFPPTYLFIPLDHVRPCCIGGFHSIVVRPGDASNKNRLKTFVFNYSTWEQPIFRDPTVLDVHGLSHEISETYNDPFITALDGVHDITPWWIAPNGNCQDDLEVGDVIEGLPHQVFPITMPNGFTYHPQNEALLQWFEFQAPSTALHGAYSYPDETILTALSAPQKPIFLHGQFAGCTAP